MHTGANISAAKRVDHFRDGIYESRLREGLPKGDLGAFTTEASPVADSTRLQLSGMGGSAIIHTKLGLVQLWRERRNDEEDALDGVRGTRWNETAEIGEGRAIRLAEAYYARSGRKLRLRLEKISRGRNTPNCYTLIFRPEANGFPVLDSWYEFEIGYRSGKLVFMDLADHTETDAPPILPRASQVLDRKRLEKMAIDTHLSLSGTRTVRDVGKPEVGYYVPKKQYHRSLSANDRKQIEEGRAKLVFFTTITSERADGAEGTTNSRIYLDATTGGLVEANVSNQPPPGQGIGGR